MSEQKREIVALNKEMERIDQQLLSVLDERARVSRRLGELRRGQLAALPLGDHAAVEALVGRGSGAMPAEGLREILRAVYANCLALEMPLVVAFCGPEGGSVHATARRRFGVMSQYLSAESAALTLEEVTRRRAEFAVVPFETTDGGLVQTTVLALTATELRIVEVMEAPFELHLMNRSGDPADIRKTYVTPADGLLCQRALDALATPCEVVDVKTPLQACQLAAEDPSAAAAASEVFGTDCGLRVARAHVSDAPVNRVRYAIVGKRPSSRTGQDVTAFVFSVQDAPGTLLHVLQQLAERGINLIKIQSFSMGAGGWSYLFFAELQGHATDRVVITTLEEVKRVTKFVKLLGSFRA